jgi:hypothetical protein
MTCWVLVFPIDLRLERFGLARDLWKVWQEVSLFTAIVRDAENPASLEI